MRSSEEQTAPGGGDTSPTAGEIGLELVSPLCAGGSCPAVYRTNRGTLVVQGMLIAPEGTGIDLPAGESLVELPTEMLLRVAEILGGSGASSDDS